jgi:hypothetical protein
MAEQRTADRGGFTSFRDMFDGGGPGRSGERFEGGGALSSLGNALGGPAMFGGGDGINMGRVAGGAIGGMALGPIGGLLGGLIGGGMGRGGYGYTDAMGNAVSPRMDMMDGGGRGMAGDTFQGGLLSVILNAMGVRPAGYDARQAAMASASQGAPSLMAAPVVSTRAMRPMMRPQAPMAMTAGAAQPGMNTMPDGETFLRQNIAAIPAINRPMMSMPSAEMSGSQMTPPMRPQGSAGRALTPYEMMLERFRASGNPVMTTAPGSLRPVGVLGR